MDHWSGVNLERFKLWIDLDFPQGGVPRQRFEHLCSIGCDPRLLHSFLSLAIYSARSPRTVHELYKVSRSGLINLPDELERIAIRVESVNRLLAEYLRSRFVDNAHLPDETRDRCRLQTAVYQGMPELLRLLAGHLRMATEWLQDNVGPKKYDTFRQSVLELLKYVDTCTNSPHYEDVSELLVRLFLVQERTFRRGAESTLTSRRKGVTKEKPAATPKLLSSPDALKALYRRSVTYGFRNAPGPFKPRSA